MLFPRSMSLLRHVSLLSAAIAFSFGTAHAQFSTSTGTTNPTAIAPAESSSSSLQLVSDEGESLSPAAPLALAAAGRGGGQNDASGKPGLFNHLTFEAGAGFNAPVGNDTPYITWGGNFTVGGGYRFSRRVSALLEFQFIDDKLPGAFIAAGGGQGGNAHIFSITGSPVFDLFPKASNSIYLTGGGGYYHKSTNFTVQVCCDFFGYPVNVTSNSFSSDQAGANFGLGYTHRIGGVYGDGTMKFFAEARYLYIHTPPITQTNGLGTTELIPVTFGVRW
jgi:hypothetical protein